MERLYDASDGAESRENLLFGRDQHMWPEGLLDLDAAPDTSSISPDLEFAPANLPISYAEPSDFNANNDMPSGLGPTPSMTVPTNKTDQPAYESLIILNSWLIPSSSATAAAPWEGVPWHLELQEQSICTKPCSRSGDDAGPLTDKYEMKYGNTHLHNTEDLKHPGERGPIGPAWPLTIVGEFEASLAVTPTSYSGLHKHHHDTESLGYWNPAQLEGQGLPQKGFGDGEQDWFLGAASSKNDTLDETVSRNPAQEVYAPGAVRYRVKTLVSSNANAQGMHSYPLLGSSFQQEGIVTSAQDQLPRLEGGVEEEVWPHIDHVMQPQAENNPIPIPNNLSKRYRTLLAATESDWECGTVRDIMCRLCLGVGFRTWERFKRHCDTTEAHPLKIKFCDRCGDFFARSDALKRHRNNPPRNCRNANPEEARQKLRKTEMAHNELLERLERCMKTGEEVGMHFARIVKKMYPESSKKRTGRRGRVDPRA